MDDDRGVIRNKQFATQVRDFHNLRFGNITPTDIDGLIEYKDLCFVFMETKYEDAPLPDGQRKALERLCDSLNKPAIVIITSHHSQGDIDMGNTTVSEFRFRKQWHKPESETTCMDLTTRFIAWVESDWMGSK